MKLKVQQVYTDGDETLIIVFKDGLRLYADRVNDGDIKVSLETNTTHVLNVIPGSSRSVTISVAEPKSCVPRSRSKKPRKPFCSDCGAKGEMTGHMGCQYPMDRS